MRPLLLASACLLPCLAACSPGPAGTAAPPAALDAAAGPAAATAPVAAEPAEAAPTPARPEAAPQSASIAGAIREGNRPPPALRICAHPLAGGDPTCIDSPAGATAYRLEVAPGRYFLLGWAQGADPAVLAHALQVRCIRAPCPPDELIEVAVAAGEHRTGIDLAGAYARLPAGWPSRP